MIGPFIILVGISVTLFEVATRKPRRSSEPAEPASTPAADPAVSSTPPKDQPAA